jgi:hypothetical protein
MARFYFHIREGGKVIADEEGIELPSVEAVRKEALRCARDLLADAIKFGKPTVPEALVIADEAGQPVEIVQLAAVLPEPLRRL